MRLPLFNTGLPQLAEQYDNLATGGNVIFDVLALPEDQWDNTYVITLFAFVSGAGVAAGGDANVALVDAEDTVYPVRFSTIASGSGVKKILDRFPLRGGLRMLAGMGAGYAGDDVYFFGYYELDGTETQAPRYRPLEPIYADVGDGPPLYTYVPVAFDSVVGEAPVHAFSSTYLDEVTLTAGGFNAGAGDPEIIVADGVSDVTIPVNRASFRAWPFFENQPFRAASQNAVNGRLPGIYLRNPSNTALCMAWGHFARG